MEPGIDIPEPILFNPLKHHLGYIREFTEYYASLSNLPEQPLLKILKHTGGSVMDVYSGSLGCEAIGNEVSGFLLENNLLTRKNFILWTGRRPDDYRTIKLTDGSEWVAKYYNHRRWVHIFPARMSPHSFRIKANTLKSAILYQIFSGKDYISGEGLNSARAKGGLPPVKEVYEAEAITAMIELIRG